MTSIDPKIWGSSAWKLLHDISFYIAESKDKGIMEKASAFFGTLRHVLPCTKCQYAFDIHMLHIPFPSKKTVFPRWVFDIHNRVNDTLDRKIVKPEWNEWVREYPTEITHHRLKDIWPFIQSIVEMHPGRSRNTPSLYEKNLRIFLKHTWEFLYKMDGYDRDAAILKAFVEMKDSDYDKIVVSKSNLRKWITDTGKKIHSELILPSSQCDSSCHR